MPRPARDRHLYTVTIPGTDDVLGPVWEVEIVDQEAPAVNDDLTIAPPDRPQVTVEFRVARFPSGTLAVTRWSITGHEAPSTQQSRFPLRTYARAALFAVEDTIAAQDALDAGEPERIAGPRYPAVAYKDGKLRQADKAFRLIDGQILDPRARKPRRPGPSTRPRTRTGNDQLQARLPVAADEYRRAVSRGSRSPTVDVAAALNVGRSTAARAISEARQQGLLGPARRTSPGELAD